MQKIETKDLAPIKAQATKAYKYAGELVIKTPEDEKKAITELSSINKIGDNVAEKKEAIMRPLLDATKATRELFKPLEDSVASAVSIIKKKLIDYRTAAEKKETEAKAKIAARVEKGTMKMETAVAKTEAIGTLDKTIGTDEGAVQYKTVRKARIIDPKKVPAEYLVVDEPKAKKAALALGGLGELIPGVEVYEEKELANQRY